MKFGYQVINGKYAINKIQAEIINESMLDYIKGVSLKTKAEQPQDWPLHHLLRHSIQ